jgi:hypothetical protein
MSIHASIEDAVLGCRIVESVLCLLAEEERAVGRVVNPKKRMALRQSEL